MNRVFITGASGFVGANLTRRLLSDGHQLTLLLREDHQTWRLSDIVSDCRVVIGDVADAALIEETFKHTRPQWVFHLAAYGAYPTQTGLERMLRTNCLGCSSLLSACAKWGTEAFVQTGSSSEYGYKRTPALESDVLEPNSHYAITKAAATHLCAFLSRSSGTRAATLRLYSAYGPFEEPTRLIPTLLVECLAGRLPLLASPTIARDFVFVDDVVDAIILTAKSSAIAPGTVLNVSTGIQSSLAMVVQEARHLLGVTAEPQWNSIKARPWDTDIWVGNSNAIRDTLGWRPKVSLREGLSQMIAWLSQNPALLSLYMSKIELAR
jgi:nucleoside-diphosphate-sugar epimerase